MNVQRSQHWMTAARVLPPQDSASRPSLIPCSPVHYGTSEPSTGLLQRAVCTYSKGGKERSYLLRLERSRWQAWRSGS